MAQNDKHIQTAEGKLSKPLYIIKYIRNYSLEGSLLSRAFLL